MDEKQKLDALESFFRAKKITQVEMANQLGVTKSAINAYMKGRSAFGRQTAIAWSKAFGVRVNFLLYGEEPIEDSAKQYTIEEVSPDDAATVTGGTSESQSYSIDKILEIMDRNSRTMLSQQETIAELMNELKKRM